MINLYLWLKAFHIIAVVAWMAGLFYLPRLLVYHAETARVRDLGDLQGHGSAAWRDIMVPAAIRAWVLGLALLYVTGQLQ